MNVLGKCFLLAHVSTNHITTPLAYASSRDSPNNGHMSTMDQNTARPNAVALMADRMMKTAPESRTMGIIDFDEYCSPRRKIFRETIGAAEIATLPKTTQQQCFSEISREGFVYLAFVGHRQDCAQGCLVSAFFLIGWNHESILRSWSDIQFSSQTINPHLA